MLGGSPVMFSCRTTLVFLCLGVLVVEGQDEIITATNESQLVYSPGFDTGTYGSSEDYHYRITTNYPENFIRLTPIQCAIESSPKHGCTDKLFIYDGYNQSADLLMTFCCDESVSTINSTGGVVYMVFESDSSVEELGFEMSVISVGETPSGTSSPPTEDCPLTCPTDCVEYTDYTGVIMGCTVGTVTVLAIMLSVLLCFINRPNLVSPMDRELLGSPRGMRRRAKTQVEQVEVPITPNHDVDNRHCERIDTRHHERSFEGYEHPLRAPNGHHKNHLPPY